MNNTQVQPETFYDSLSLAHKLDDILDGFKLEEVHLFSYFSSILYLYKGNVISDWTYKFIIDTNGYPFSSDLNSAMQRHIKNGLFDKRGDFYLITSRGTDEFNKFKKLATLSTREEYLSAACTTNILVPYSQTIRALLNDPEIDKNKQINGNKWLNQSDTYEKFREISEAVGVPSDDLIIPAVTWVNYINENEKFEQSREI